MLVDSHCHLDFKEFESDFEDVLKRAASRSVSHFVTISTRISEFHRIVKVASRNKAIFCSVGNHPSHSSEEPELTAEQIAALCSHPKVVGIGETGLDFHYDYSPKDIQKKTFIEHIKASQKTKLPLIIHSREAEDDTIELLQSHYNKEKFPILLHCFTSKLHLAEAALELGGYISFSGIITFKKSEELQEIVKKIPLDRILVETDSPYLAPQSNRGKRNEPAFLVEVAQKIAELKNVSYEEVASVTTNNFEKLFWKAKL